MDFTALMQNISMFTVITATILMAIKKPYYGFIVGTLGQITWITYAALTVQWGLGIQSVFLLFISIYGLLQWRSDARRSRNDSVSSVSWHTVHIGQE